MEEENISDILEERKKLPKEAKNIIFSFIFFNCLMGIVMGISVFAINFSYNKLSLKDFELFIKTFQIILAITSVILFEISYRKDSGKLAIYAIELLLFSIAVLFVPYMYISNNNIFFLKIILIVFSIYFVLKSIILALVFKNKYIRDNMSDVKEIVKKDEVKGYLNEKSEKTIKSKKKNNKNVKKEE